ncbi:hypothetical protein FXF51_59630 [Nonomuraea sp. PA05]|nr:hypothetical protein FXF51_59630 [Nonomuraea sp. PA05]
MPTTYSTTATTGMTPLLTAATPNVTTPTSSTADVTRNARPVPPASSPLTTPPPRYGKTKCNVYSTANAPARPAELSTYPTRPSVPDLARMNR